MENNYTLKNKIKENVGSHKLELALENLLKLYDIHSDKNFVIQVKAQYSKLKNDLLSGTASRSEENTEISKITRNILDLVDRFENESEKPKNGKYDQQADKIYNIGKIDNATFN